MAKGQNLLRSGAGRKAPAKAPIMAAPVGATAAAAVPMPKKPRVGPVQFLREVRAEARKVTWTSWKETWITSVMVGIMVVLTALFFFGLDTILNLGMTGVLKLAIGD
jgi:preprotein translocase subunit SecE